MRPPLPRLTLILLILVFPVAAQQSFKIAKIDFEGLNRVSADEMLATTGLKIGDSFSVESLDA
ncbi:MAG TPA: hypothetical protein VFR80_13010, partial [Pyrinomonadaceae bacterium]|nr:hypothetical protein [Pyrinomonadaceae bacterium]